MTNHVIQPATSPTLQWGCATQLADSCVRAGGGWKRKCFVPESSGRCLGAAGGGIESPPEKINNALVCKVTGASSQTFKAARVTVAPGEEQTGCVWEEYFPTHDIIPGMAAALKKKKKKSSQFNQKRSTRPDVFQQTRLSTWLDLVREQWELSKVSVWLLIFQEAC